MSHPDQALILHNVCSTYGLDPAQVMSSSLADQGFRMALLARANTTREERSDGQRSQN